MSNFVGTLHVFSCISIVFIKIDLILIRLFLYLPTTLKDFKNAKKEIHKIY